MAKKKSRSALTLEELESRLKKDLGDGNFYRGSEKEPLSRIKTGHISFDRHIGGGFPRGRIIELYGKQSSGKSLIALKAIAEAQKQGDICVYVDLEKTFDPDWAAKNGVDVEALRVLEPTNGEEAYDIIIEYLMTDQVGLIVVDSIAQVVPKAELEGNMSDANIGLAARLNAKAMRKITTVLKSTTVLLINQTRANVSTGPFGGAAEVTTGGKAIAFYASLRIGNRRIGWIEESGEKVGARYVTRITKSKIPGAHPNASCEFAIEFDSGLDVAQDVLDLALEQKLVEQRGAWFVFDEETKVQGKPAAKQHILESGLYEKWYTLFTTGEVLEDE